MGRFPIIRPDHTISGRATGVRANIDTSTGPGTGLGIGLAKLGVQVLKMYSDTVSQTQLSEFQRNANEGFNNLKLSFVQPEQEDFVGPSQSADPEMHIKQYKRFLETLPGSMPKHKGAAGKARLWQDVKEPRWEYEVQLAMIGKANENWLAELASKELLIARTGEMGSFEAFINDGVKNNRIDKDDAVKRIAKAETMAIEEQISKLYRAGEHDLAKKALEASPLSEKEKEILEDEIDKDYRAGLLEFESGINDQLVEIDNDPNMTQENFNDQARSLKETILTAKIPGTKKKAMLSSLEKWRTGTNEIDYAKILSLNQEMDAAMRSGIVDPTIRNRIVSANLEGSFGGRYKGGQKTYADMIRRFEKLAFDERAQAVSFIVKAFDTRFAKYPDLVFLFHQAKDKFIADNPDMSSNELFVAVSGLAESYSDLSDAAIQRGLNQGNRIIMTGPDGNEYSIPAEKREKFLEWGYTE